MKKILLSLILTLMSMNLFSQSLPQYYIDVNRQKIINSLKTNLELEERNRKLCEKSSSKKDTIITNSEKIITNVKTERNWAYLGATTFLITTILLLLFH